MRFLSLFSGGGLGDYGLELAGMECVGQVEIDNYCQKILALRWPNVPKWRDIKNVKGKEVLERCGTVDLISGGFPCQPFSHAGKRRGSKDDRHLWPEMFRVISEIKPSFVLGENVSGIIRTALDDVLLDLESIGYTCQAFVIPACAFDAQHRRDRVWILAYRGYDRRGSKSRKQQKERPEITYPGSPGNVADPNGGSWSVWRHREFSKTPQNEKSRDYLGRGEKEYVSGKRWPTEPRVGRVVDGITNRVDRLKMLGNGQVVQVVRWIGSKIVKFWEEES